ncbi:MAG: hypothetical protein ACKOWG_14945 [Planctomycetia bacterium]
MTAAEPTPSSRRRFVAALGAAAAALGAAVVGCSTSSKKSAGSSKKKSRTAHRDGKRPKGPKTMGNLLVDGYIDDLKSGPAAKQVAAAQELCNMGAGAKKALPALESLTKNGDAQVREAAQQAIKAIRK